MNVKNMKIESESLRFFLSKEHRYVFGKSDCH
jgi:hypothetical protein